MSQNPKDQKQHLSDQMMVDKIDYEHDGVTPFLNSAFHQPHANAQEFHTGNNNGGGNNDASNDQYGQDQGQQDEYGNNQQEMSPDDIPMVLSKAYGHHMEDRREIVDNLIQCEGVIDLYGGMFDAYGAAKNTPEQPAPSQPAPSQPASKQPALKQPAPKQSASSADKMDVDEKKASNPSSGQAQAYGHPDQFGHANQKLSNSKQSKQVHHNNDNNYNKGNWVGVSIKKTQEQICSNNPQNTGNAASNADLQSQMSTSQSVSKKSAVKQQQAQPNVVPDQISMNNNNTNNDLIWAPNEGYIPRHQLQDINNNTNSSSNNYQQSQQQDQAAKD